MGILNFFKRKNNDINLDSSPGSNPFPSDNPFTTMPEDDFLNSAPLPPGVPVPKPKAKQSQKEPQKTSPPDFNSVPDLFQKLEPMRNPYPPQQIPQSIQQSREQQDFRPKVLKMESSSNPLKDRTQLGLADDSEMVVEFSQKDNPFMRTPATPNFSRSIPQEDMPSESVKYFSEPIQPIPTPRPLFQTQQQTQQQPMPQREGPKAFMVKTSEAFPEKDSLEPELPEFSTDELPILNSPEAKRSGYIYDSEVFLPKKHVFINVKDHHDILSQFGSIIARIEQGQKAVDRVEFLIDNRENTYMKLKIEMEDIQRKLVLVDKVLFEDNPYFNP